ncbi:MAG TPA: DMT family transporter [Alphaproteobacteria bacterium]|nr:DMT family transporter [Alphaproteobacteria bacterium]
MDPLVIGAVLAASLLHASWHALVKSTADRLTALAGMNLVAGVVALGLIPFVRVPSGFVFLVIAASVVLHVGYKVGLAALYVRADLGQAYPMARGLTPVMATLLGFLTLGELPRPSVLVGVALVSAGLLALTRENVARRVTARMLAVAAVTGLCVAAYSVLDAYGIRVSGDWFGFTVWLVLCDCATFLAYTFAAQGIRPVVSAWHERWGRVIVSGLFGIVSFGVFLWALGRAPVGGVTALRETSVLFAAILGTAFLKEAATWMRYAAAVSVMAGIVAIAVFR